MKVHVDEERCEGHGRCYALAPAVFEPDDVGNGKAIGDGIVAARGAKTEPASRPPTAPSRPSRSTRTADMSTTDDHPPVQDWATDFDHTDEAYAADPFPIWDEIRASGARSPTPIATAAPGCPPRHADVAEIAYDTEHFTSRSILMSQFRPPLEIAPAGIAPPISSDPPFHQRRPAPAAAGVRAPGRSTSSRRPRADYCEELIEAMGDRDVVDAAKEYAQHIPVRVIARMLGFPEEDADRFRGFVHHVLEGVALPMEEREAG